MGFVWFFVCLCNIVYSFVTKSIVVAPLENVCLNFSFISSSLKMRMQGVFICFILAFFIRRHYFVRCVFFISELYGKLFAYYCQHGVQLLSNFYHIIIICTDITHSYLLEMHMSVFQWLEFVFVGAFTSSSNIDIQGRNEGWEGGKKKESEKTQKDN